MANLIKIKRKTTSGAPTIGSLVDGEFCVVVPDSTLYLRIDASTLILVNGLDDPLIVGDHGTDSNDEVVNICYGTSATPPAANTTTEGALYIQYTP